MEGVPDPIAWLIVAAAGVTAALTIWRKVIIPFAKLVGAINRIADATPVLIDIAEEFRPNGGSSLRDTVDRIETGMVEAVKIGHDNTERLILSGDQMHEHLRRVAWADERAEIIARLSLMEDRQARLIDGVLSLLATAESPLAVAAARVIEEAVTVEEVAD